MKIIIIMEKWCDLNPVLGPTSAHSNIYGSIPSNISWETFHYDEFLVKNGYPIDDFLLERVKTEKPDAVVVSYYPFEEDSRNVSLETFLKIKQEVPVIFIWFDFVHSHIQRLVEKVSRYNSLNVIVDIFVEPTENYLPMWVPQDESLFSWSEDKPVNVVFSGSTAMYPERKHYLESLRNLIYITGGQREGCLSIEQYAQSLKQAKISLNFPAKPDGLEQAKSRIYESMLCGALLLERENSCIKRWFTPMQHYVPFFNEQDLVNKIDYYLSHDEERIKIARNGHEKMKEYSGKNWWEKVLDASLNHL